MTSLAITYVPPAAIVALVGKRLGLTIEQIQSPHRSRSIVTARFIIFALFRKYHGMKLGKIGQYFSIDHTTVMAGLRRLDDMIAKEEWVKDGMDYFDSIVSRGEIAVMSELMKAAEVVKKPKRKIEPIALGPKLKITPREMADIKPNDTARIEMRLRWNSFAEWNRRNPLSGFKMKLEAA